MLIAQIPSQKSETNWSHIYVIIIQTNIYMSITLVSGNVLVSKVRGSVSSAALFSRISQKCILTFFSSSSILYTEIVKTMTLQNIIQFLGSLSCCRTRMYRSSVLSSAIDLMYIINCLSNVWSNFFFSFHCCTLSSCKASAAYSTKMISIS